MSIILHEQQIKLGITCFNKILFVKYKWCAEFQLAKFKHSKHAWDVYLIGSLTFALYSILYVG